MQEVVDVVSEAPRFVSVLLELLEEAKEVAESEGLGTIEGKATKVSDTLTIVEALFTDSDGHAVKYRIYAAGFLQKKFRNISMVKIEKLDHEDNVVGTIHIENHPYAVAAIMTF